ncbi:hypothetical protein A2867_03170 [Candidatus Daviesbacteria bacterium RIFCSPHIGHO2_01_FULL_40_11]|uniref:Endonuclease/exonuclease/phosphatase domain-containing protein n=1 Tax=Candidatus Daviesbacteria bacterium RIFCSPHIGHO2_01_FULL_40_11 TaxID=1797762 RepID=A0A1F5JL50_9BACT|nr:MAG: hypothetical protein A2867_03170 [Candidatus Daviesbacteria bacterium RIFCSPHIGHO2_01_FULL_40_11]OGE63023.1 MAG: hypothetical protein A2964_02290 [Candidatus Daviesbacteria bacterium RIFCSPLOWO2_01_FULL_40_27]
MKLISLNTWGGKVYQPLIVFIKQQSRETDIFCFQEVYNTQSSVKHYKDIRANLLGEFMKVLPNFQFFYSMEAAGFDSTPKSVDFHLTFGKTIFIKNHFKVDKAKDILLYGDREEKLLKQDFSNLAVTLQSISFTAKEKAFTIVNIHGTAFPGSKLDTKLRQEHSTEIKNFLNSKRGAKVLVGDFNLLPQTQSIKILEEDMRNLIKKYNIWRTRSNLNPYFGKPDFQKYADYTFVSADIKVINFQVPPVNISDHLPMILEFS